MSFNFFFDSSVKIKYYNMNALITMYEGDTPSSLRTAYCPILALRTAYRQFLAFVVAYRLTTKTTFLAFPLT